MTAEFIPELVGAIQGVAINYKSWRGEDTALANFIALAMKNQYTQNELDSIRRLLHSKEMQAALQVRDVALWRGQDGLLRLVDQQTIGNRAAALRVQHHPGDKCCRFCLMRENPGELIPETNLRGEYIQGSFVHAKCAAAFDKMKRQAEK